MEEDFIARLKKLCVDDGMKPEDFDELMKLPVPTSEELRRMRAAGELPKRKNNKNAQKS